MNIKWIHAIYINNLIFYKYFNNLDLSNFKNNIDMNIILFQCTLKFMDYLILIQYYKYELYVL